MKKKCALFGGGNIARKRYFLFDDLFEIECCYDNDENKCMCGGGVLYDIPIRRWKKGKNTAFIIITSDRWREIALQLEGEGLELGRDYLPYYIFDDLQYSTLYYLRKDFLNGKYLDKEWDYTLFLPDKRLAVLYGNCQMGVYRNALTLNREFNENYVIIDIPKVWEYKYQPELFEFFLNDESFWKIIKLFIYQFISKTNPFFEGLASEYCIQKLNVECRKAAIISFDFRGYFPQLEEFSGGMFPGFRDKYVDALIRQGIKTNDIINIICDEWFIPDKEIEDCIKNSLSGLKKKDKFADVKIYDYVEKNYMKEQLFYSPLHPCYNLLREYTHRIFLYLGLRWDIAGDFFHGICCGGMMRGADTVIYPSVIRKLGLRKYENRFYFNGEYVLEGMTLDFKQCMEIYIKRGYMIREEK